MPYLFVWQTDNDWDNHSLVNIYKAMFTTEEKFALIYKGTPTYPVSINVKSAAMDVVAAVEGKDEEVGYKVAVSGQGGVDDEILYVM